jgi:hypothetical protein
LVAGEVWERAPRILDYFIFHARSLSVLRDYKWLNAPPANIEGGVQAVDFRYAVTSSAGKYTKEGDNFGKILRIWSESAPLPDPSDVTLERTAKAQVRLGSSARWRGFEFYARKILQEFANTDKEELRDAEGNLIGWTAEEISALFSPVWRGRRLDTIPGVADRVVSLDSRFNWKVRRVGPPSQLEASGRKPSELFKYLRESSAQSGPAHTSAD